MISYKEKRLRNGIRVIVAPMRATNAVTLLVLVGTGSNYETKRVNGISHFLEHLFFKGTKSRPNAGEVNRTLDQMGAEHNAFTSNEWTGYWVKSARQHFNTALDVVSDILLEPLLKKEEIERERGVILQEISMYEDMPQRKVSEHFEELLYGNQPAGWNIAGTPESVRRIARGDIIRYKTRQYVASNAVVVVAGNIDSGMAFRKVEKTFSAMPKGRARASERVTETQRSPGVRLVWKKSDQTHLLLGTRTFSMFDRRRYALAILSGILGGNASSRLFMEIREHLGLAYYVGSVSQQYCANGFFTARAGVPHEALETVVRKIIEIFRDIKARGVSNEELSGIKSHLRGTLALAYETSDEIAFHLGEEALLRKKIILPDEDLRRLERVTTNEVRDVAKEIFRSRTMNLAVVGPHRKTALYKDILRGIV